MLGHSLAKILLIVLATLRISHCTSLPDRKLIKSNHACKLPVTINSVQVASGNTNLASSFFTPSLVRTL